MDIIYYKISRCVNSYVVSAGGATFSEFVVQDSITPTVFARIGSVNHLN